MHGSPLDSTDLQWLSGLARALVGTGSEDLVQDAAVAAMERGIPAGVPRRAWLRGVARRLAARRYRADGRRAWREAQVARPEALSDGAELVQRAELAEQVTAAARRLPEPYRRTILLKFLEGRSAEEIAREEEKPADTVRWRVRRGLELLRAELVQDSDRDWSAWSVLLLPLARSGGSTGLVTAGASGGALATVALGMTMKGVLVVLVVGCLGVWLALGNGSDGSKARLGMDAVPVDPGAGDPGAGGEARFAAAGGLRRVDRAADRTAAAEDESEAPPVQASSGDLFGRVVNEAGEAVSGASVYWLGEAEGDGGDLGSVLEQTTSDWEGGFRLAAVEPEGPSPALGVVANGYLRTVVSDVAEQAAKEGEGLLTIVLDRGRSLAGRVVDEAGSPVPGLELLVFTANAGVSHVSPSQRRLRAQRRLLSWSGYGQSLARSDGRGEVQFQGLPATDWGVLSMDPGWEIVDSARVTTGDPYVMWTVARRLGVLLEVVDANTGRPAERAAATFRAGITFADGEELDLGQWVGRGRGEVSFVLGPEAMPGLKERTITEARFYGTVRSGSGPKVVWKAEPIVDLGGATGVARARVDVESAPEISEPAGAAQDPERTPATATLDLEVRYADAAPFEGQLRVRWTSPTDRKVEDSARVKPYALGRYRVELPALELDLEIDDRSASGSLPSWTGRVSLPSQQTEYVTLPRGATAEIQRPEGWRGEWFLRASYRTAVGTEWRGSWGYSTDETTLTLPVLRPAEWRFELRQDSALERDPTVRTVTLADGEYAKVN